MLIDLRRRSTAWARRGTILAFPRPHSRGGRQGKERGTAIVTTVPGQPRGSAVIPFVGLAEGLVLAVIRRSSIPLQRVRPALDRLQRELGLTHALASKALYTDGAEVLYDFAEQQGDTAEARQCSAARRCP